MLFQLLPKIFFEDFTSLQDKLRKKHWPSDPKFIFTCNSFEYNEIFKLFSAQKSESGTPLFIGQHGNNYGTNSWTDPTNEEEIASNFLTWGWSTENHNYIPHYISRNYGKDYAFDPCSENITLVQTTSRPMMAAFDERIWFEKYRSDQFNFMSSLPENIQSKIIVRLAPNSYTRNQTLLRSWNLLFPKQKIQAENVSFFETVKVSKLIIFSYDSTGILELSSQNIPFLAFWQEDLSHVTARFLPLYRSMIKEGIFHTSPVALANHLTHIESDIQSWWNSDSVARARNDFTEVLARRAAGLERKLARCLVSKANMGSTID